MGAEGGAKGFAQRKFLRLGVGWRVRWGFIALVGGGTSSRALPAAFVSLVLCFTPGGVLRCLVSAVHTVVLHAAAPMSSAAPIMCGAILLKCFAFEFEAPRFHRVMVPLRPPRGLVGIGVTAVRAGRESSCCLAFVLVQR